MIRLFMRNKLLFIGLILILTFLYGTSEKILKKKGLKRDALIEDKILELTNLERKKKGLKPLELEGNLSFLAKIHAIDMVINKYCSHINKKGEDMLERAKKYGVYRKKLIGKDSYIEWIGAENLMCIEDKKLTGLHPNKVAETFVKFWMKNKSHRENILSKIFSQTGIGIYFEENRYCAVQNFF